MAGVYPWIIEAPTLVESFWATGRDEAYFEAGLLTAGIEHGVEVWCVVPNEVAHQRVLTRTRHRAHHDRERASEWDGITGGAKPISRFPIVEVDTSREVDVPGLANAVRALLPELPRN